MKRTMLIILTSLFVICQVYSQESIVDNTETLEDQVKGEIAKSTLFTIPSSPAFSLLDVNPSKVNKPGTLRDFQFDWIVKDNTLSPDIALEVNPIWLLFYRNINYSKYRKQGYLKKTLSTLSFSVGTVKRDEIQSLAYGFKLTLYRKAAPMSPNYVDRIKPVFTEEEKDLTIRKELYERKLKEGDLTKEEKAEYKKIKSDLQKIIERETMKFQHIKEEYEKENWNATALDIGFGGVYNYEGDSLEKLDFENKGTGLWINGCLGFGKNWLLSGLFRYIKMDGNNQYFGGMNLRYGSSRANFFVEGVYESMDLEDKITIAYGGEYKINRKLMLEFGIRSEYDQDFKFSNLKPIAKLNWILNKN